MQRKFAEIACEMVPANRPLRPVRTWANDALAGTNARLSATV